MLIQTVFILQEQAVYKSYRLILLYNVCLDIPSWAATCERFPLCFSMEALMRLDSISSNEEESMGGSGCLAVREKSEASSCVRSVMITAFSMVC